MIVVSNYLIFNLDTYIYIYIYLDVLHLCSNRVRAFPTHFGCILYFTTLKSIFSIIHTHFYITPYIPFSTLQSIILKYYKIILFLYIFFHTPTIPTASIKTQPINHNLNNPINNQAQPKSTTHSRLLNHGNHP